MSLILGTNKTERISKMQLFLLPGSSSSHMICLGTYIQLIGYGRDALQTVKECVKNNTDPTHGLSGKISNNINVEMMDNLDEHFVDLEMQAIPRVVCIVCTMVGGNETRKNDKEFKELSATMSKRRCYQIFCCLRGWEVKVDAVCRMTFDEIEESKGELIPSWPTYLKFWKENYPLLGIQSKASDICGECWQIANS